MSFKINEDYHICRTGSLEQYYTLYVTRTISNESFYNQTCYYWQNLSFTEEESIKKVKEIIKNRKGSAERSIDFSDSKKREYCNLEAFGFKWKKTPKGFIVNLFELENSLRNKFWRLWKEKKPALKKAGFSVFKRDRDSDVFILFFKNCPEDELPGKLALLDVDYPIEGDYIGKLGERLKNVPVTCSKLSHSTGIYGPKIKIHFLTENGTKIITDYQGTKYQPEEGKKYDLTGTVTKQDIFSFIKTTVVNRIILK